MMWKFDRFASRKAVIAEDGFALTYAELNAECKKLCKAVGERCLVFSICSNTMGSFLGYTAFLNGNIVPVMLSAEIDSELLMVLYEKYKPAYLWAPTTLVLKDTHAVYERFGYALLKTPFGTQTKMYDQLALLLTTSGSTGSPKFVRQSYRNIAANAESIAAYLRLTMDERPITTLPMNYTYGLSILNSHLLVGATILLCASSITQREFWNFLKEQQATSFGGVPYTYEMLNRMRFTRMQLPSLRTMTQAGGKLTPELHRVFAEFCQNNGMQFIVMYGQCEATARMSYLPWEAALQKIGSMGIAIPGGRFALIDTEGNPVTQPKTVGELRYYGENVTLGYAETAEDLLLGDARHGILDTGDMAMFDEDGYFFIVGRKKRFLKVYGNRVNLDEAEGLLKSAFESCDCACGGTDDHLIIFSTDESLLPAMRTYLSDKTGLNPNAFLTKHLQAIPKNDSGKTLYRELEKYYV